MYDDFDRLIQEAPGGSDTRRYVYDAQNNVIQMTDALNIITTSTWNHGHLLASRVTNATAPSAFNFSYNNLGQTLTASANLNGNVATLYTHTYDPLNRVDTIRLDGPVIGQVSTLDYDYSPAGRLTRLRDGHGNETNYLYDAVGRLSGLWATNYGTLGLRYDAGGRLVEKWLPTGVSTRNTWNTDGTLAHVVNKASASLTASQHDYLYDAYGNRRQHKETINAGLITYDYTYDKLDRLLSVKNGTAAQDQGFVYNALDQLTQENTGTPVTNTRTHVYNPSGQRTASTLNAQNVAGYVYDLRGSLTKKCLDNAGGVDRKSVV